MGCKGKQDDIEISRAKTLTFCSEHVMFRLRCIELQAGHRMRWCLLALLLGALIGGENVAYAQDARTSNRPSSSPIHEYEWWLIRWSDNAILLPVPDDHEGLPTWTKSASPAEPSWLTEWWNTRPCASRTTSLPTMCEGVSLTWRPPHRKSKRWWLSLPKPTVWLTLEGLRSADDARRIVFHAPHPGAHRRGAIAEPKHRDHPGHL